MKKLSWQRRLVLFHFVQKLIHDKTLLKVELKSWFSQNNSTNRNQCSPCSENWFTTKHYWMLDSNLWFHKKLDQEESMLLTHKTLTFFNLSEFVYHKNLLKVTVTCWTQKILPTQTNVRFYWTKSVSFHLHQRPKYVKCNFL